MAEEFQRTEARAAGDGKEETDGRPGVVHANLEFGELRERLRAAESLCTEAEQLILDLQRLRHEAERRHVSELLRIKQELPYRLGIVMAECGRNPLMWPLTGFKLYRAWLDWKKTNAIPARPSRDPDGPDRALRERYDAAERAQDYFQACDTIVKLDRLYGNAPSPEQRKFMIELKATPAYMLTILDEVSPRTATPVTAAKRLCYVVHNTLPISSGGYAVRTHGVAIAIKQAGWDVVVLSRPGYPLDVKPDLSPAQVARTDTLDGITYARTLAPLRSGVTQRDYMFAAASAIEQRLEEYRPSVVMAASNYLTAAPALIAARRLGLPFYYEIRGLWEITRASSEPGFGESPAFRVEKILEASIAARADRVFTLNEALREELVSRGIASNGITLLPNSVDPTEFTPLPRDGALAAGLGLPDGVPVIGYVGTFSEHEGLDDLARACGLLKQSGIQFRLLLVGSENPNGGERGPLSSEIHRIAGTSGFADWLIMPGRVPHEQAAPYYSLIDIAPFPRKPLPVCEIVSPLKPLEALAMEKAVVTSSVRALSEMISDGKTGLMFEKGSVESLAGKLRTLIDAPELRARLGKQGRSWVCSERTWARIGSRFDDIARAGAGTPGASDRA